MTTLSNISTTESARETILSSIRSHLAASAPHDAREFESHPAVSSDPIVSAGDNTQASSLSELFRENLEAVDGHCVIAHTEDEIVSAISGIIAQLQQTKLHGRRLALSNHPRIERLARMLTVEVDELAITPDPKKLFDYDVGITTAQAAIAETGTLVLDSERERNRLVSLVPPVHIAVVDASNIFESLGEALAVLREGDEVSSSITLITGPSRTADIELTLAIGVHGPQELYVIIDTGLTTMT